MAELGIAASILQVAAVGSSSRKVLKSLAQQLKVEKPDHTAEALETVRDLHSQSLFLFGKIKSLLPTHHKRDSLSIKQRLLWNFRKARVDYLVGQLEYLKSTTSLLLHLLGSVPKLRKYRAKKRKSAQDHEDAHLELVEAESLLFEHCRIQQQLPKLEEEAARDQDSVTALASELPAEEDSSGKKQALIKTNNQTLAVIDAYAANISGGDSRAMLLQKTTLWLTQLYDRWTTLSCTDTDGQRPMSEEDMADIAANAAMAEDETKDETNLPSATRKISGANEGQASNNHIQATGIPILTTGTTDKTPEVPSLTDNGKLISYEEAFQCKRVLSDNGDSLRKARSRLLDTRCATDLAQIRKASEKDLDLLQKAKDVAISAFSDLIYDQDKGLFELKSRYTDRIFKTMRQLVQDVEITLAQLGVDSKAKVTDNTQFIQQRLGSLYDQYNICIWCLSNFMVAGVEGCLYIFPVLPSSADSKTIHNLQFRTVCNDKELGHPTTSKRPTPQRQSRELNESEKETTRKSRTERTASNRRENPPDMSRDEYYGQPTSSAIPLYHSSRFDQPKQNRKASSSRPTRPYTQRDPRTESFRDPYNGPERSAPAGDTSRSSLGEDIGDFLSFPLRKTRLSQMWEKAPAINVKHPLDIKDDPFGVSRLFTVEGKPPYGSE